MKKFAFLMLLLCGGINVLFAQLTAPTLYGPSNNTTNMDVSKRLCVTKVSGANYYEIELDTTSNFNSPLKQTLNADTYYSYSSYYYTTVSNLLYGTKYYWRARCANSTDTTGWSAVWNFTTRAVPQLYAPDNNSTNMAVTQQLCVSQLSGSNYYEIELDTTSNFNSPLKQTLNADTYYSYSSYYYTSVSNLRYGTKYYWRARCAHSADTTGWSAVRNFTTRGVPQLYSPDNNSTNMAVTQQLCVSQLTGSNYYEIELDTTSNFNSPLKQTLNASSYNSSYSYYYTSVSNLRYGTKYYWRARCAHSTDTTGWSAVWNFTTAYQLTTAPTLISPANDSTYIDFQSVLALQWDTLANVNGYRYQVSTSSDFSTLFTQGTTAQTTASIHNLRPATTYYWRVQGYNGVGNSVWSAVWHFTTGGCPPIGTSFSHEICEGDSYDFFGRTLSSSGDYTETLTTELGCDSTVTLHLTVHPTVTSTSSVTVCENDLPYHYVDGEIDTTFEVGTPNLSVFNFQFSTQHGCDSTVILTVNIVTATEGDTTATACGSFNWHGYTNLTESGDYTDVIENAAGCDSIVTLHLTINVPTESDTTATACGSYSWHGYTNLTESGDYTDVLTNAAGCDSTVTLHLTINVPTEGDTIATACGSFNWHSYTNLTESGDYADVIENAAGCDSTVTLHLTIHTLPEVTINGGTYFCNGGSTTLTASGAETYEWSTMEFGAEFEVAEAGTYTVIGTDANGCTSTASIEVTETTINTEVYFVEVGDGFLETFQGDAEYQWIDCSTHEPIEGATQQQFTPEVSGSYACVITLGECTDTTECMDFSVGVEEWNNGSITIYPNPSTGMVNVQFTMNNIQLGNGEIQVLDVHGRLLQVVGISDACGASLQTVQIDLSRYATGVYLVRLVNGGDVITVKNVVKK